jgi:hypothetical protein
VERERRMKDPIFVMQFESLRGTIFPEIAEAVTKQQIEGHQNFKDKLLAVYSVTPSRLCTTSPFYYEDYARLFAKLKAQPMLVSALLDSLCTAYLHTKHCSEAITSPLYLY